MPENRDSSVEGEDKVMRIRTRYLKGLGAGMSVADASAYANDPTSAELPVAAPGQVELTTPPAGIGSVAAQLNSGRVNGSLSSPAAPSTEPAFCESPNAIGHQEKVNAFRQYDFGVPQWDPRVVAAILRSDLYSFIRAIFPIVSPGDAFAANWHIEAIAHQLTRLLNGEISRLIITVPPRSLKSICASVAFPVFVLGRNPRRKIICVSYSEGLASKHANDRRAVMRSTLYSRLFPETRISPAKDTELEFATTRGGSCLATSTSGTLTGRGGNLIVIDDPIKPQDAWSEVARKNCIQWYGNTLLTRLNNKTEDAIVVVMQRLHTDDLVGHLLEQEGWVQLNLPAIAECEQRIALGAKRWHLRQPGDLLHPEREPQSELDKLKRGMGSMDFGAQYQQEPIAAGGNLVKWEWFKFYDQRPLIDATDRIIVSWDTALSAKELASFSACVVLQVRGETAYVLEVIRERLEYPELRRKVMEVHKLWRNRNYYALVIENKGSGMSLIQDLQQQGIPAIAIDPVGDKVMRMNQQTARIEGRTVCLPKQAPWLDEFRREISAFPAGRHSDQVDALSQALHRAYDRSKGEFSWGYIPHA
jgi:predicted phage terminase large subunit-like protein